MVPAAVRGVSESAEKKLLTGRLRAADSGKIAMSFPRAGSCRLCVYRAASRPDGPKGGVPGAGGPGADRQKGLTGQSTQTATVTGPSRPYLYRVDPQKTSVLGRVESAIWAT